MVVLNPKKYFNQIFELVLFYYIGIVLGTIVETFKPKVDNKYQQLFITSIINAIVLVILMTVASSFVEKVQNSVGGILFVTTYFSSQNVSLK